MAHWQYDLFLVATGVVDDSALIHAIDRILPPSKSPAPRLRLWGTPDGNRIDFWTGHSPKELLVGFDARTVSKPLVESVVKLASEFQLQMRNADDVPIDANVESLSQQIGGFADRLAAAPPSEDHDGSDEE